MSEGSNCNNCGAPTKASGPDVRKGVCAFCGVELTFAIDSAQVAAGMALDTANADAFMAQLAKAFGHGFGDRAKVEWRSGRIVKVSLDLGKDMFVAVREFDTVSGQRKKMVRGVALKTMTPPIEEWVAMLHEAIAAHLDTNGRAASALAQLRVS
jgi:hypothetical protein